MKLTKRQREVMEDPFYKGFAEECWVVGADYRTAASLVRLGVLDINPYNDKFRLAGDNPVTEFPYILALVHDRLPVKLIQFTLTKDEVLGYGVKVYNQRIKPMVKEWCAENCITMKSCYVQIEPGEKK